MAPIASHLIPDDYDNAENEIEALLKILDYWDDDESPTAAGKRSVASGRGH